MKKRIFIGSFCFTLAIGLLASTSPTERYFEIAKNLSIFATLFKEVNTLYVDEVNPNALMRTGIDAMLSSLDPYTNYIPEDEVEDYRTQNSGQYGGIGAITREIGNRTVVTMLLQGYGAQKGGLKIGDELLKIGNTEIAKISREEIGHLMKGEVGTPVTLTIKRIQVPDPIILTFTREKVKVSNVPYFGMLEHDVAFIQLTDFTPEAGKEVREALTQLKAQGAKSLILDLRNNPGGLLMEAVNICNLFLPKGKRVVSIKGKIPENNLNYETLNQPVDVEIPLVVLINRGSASASEIVAGTLQDYDRAVIIGERSFGKGLVQMSRQLSYNAQLKVTTAKYYTPTGRCIQALDYSHKREDGSVVAIPDSLKKSFKTTKGRIVYDGGGIEPDIKTNPSESNSLLELLFFQGYIFDYATEYVAKNPEPVDATTFQLSDQAYADFVQWLKGKNYHYRSALDEQLQALSALAKRENQYQDVKQPIEALQLKIQEYKRNELMRYKQEIKKLIEEDIVSRFHYQRGSVEVGFKYDTDIKKSIEVIRNTTLYNTTLNQR
jgi:carboxyl-terminal processing protease